MKKKIIFSFLTLVCTLCCAMMLVACGGDNTRPKEVQDLRVARNGDQHINLLYGEKFDQYPKLELYYGDEEFEEITYDNPKLSIKYYFTPAYQINGVINTTKQRITELPETLLHGEYTLEFVYDGKTDPKFFSIAVQQTTEGAFKLEIDQTNFTTDTALPNIRIKNPQNAVVQLNEWSNQGFWQLATDDTDGDYRIRYCKKETYDNLSAEEKEFYHLGNNMESYVVGNKIYEAGEYYVFALIKETYNYHSIMTTPIKITVTEANA